MKITRENLTLLIDGARKEYIEMSGSACLPGTQKALTDSERIALSWLQSSIQVLNKMGFIDNTIGGGIGIYNGAERDSLTLEFDHPDCTTMTDGSESTMTDGPNES